MVETPFCRFATSGTIILVAMAMILMGPMSSHAQSDPDQPVVDTDDPVLDEDQLPGVYGRLVNSKGRPATNVMISAAGIGQDPQPVPELAVMTGSNGDFYWPLRPGKYRISADLPNGEHASAEVRLGEEGRAMVDLRAD